MEPTSSQHRIEDVLKDAGMVPMPDPSRERVRQRVLSEVVSAGRLARARVTLVRSATVLATTATLLTGTGFAAAASLPGDAFYPLKRAMEEIRIAFSAPQQHDEAYIEMTRERAREVRELLDSQASESAVEDAAERFGDSAERAVRNREGQAAQETVDSIQEAIEEQPPRVRERVEEQVPTVPQSPEPAKQGDSGRGSEGGESNTPAGGSGGGGSTGSDSPGSDETPSRGVSSPRR